MRDSPGDLQRWTNPSVRKLAAGGNAVEAVTGAARDVVVRALDAGWTGPPFDPFWLADFLKIALVASDDVPDARTVPAGKTALRIEFNPSRPTGRVRFSIAHELAHTLFPDCGEQVRHRGRHQQPRADEWQLEALCNLAAAEFLMPAGSLPHAPDTSLTIEEVLTLRSVYAVSAEAILLRLVRVADRRCAMFSASRSEEVAGPARYRVDYTVPSASWAASRWRGRYLPASSVVTACTAIGFTAHGAETWPGAANVRVQAVAVPPHPGSTHPRVVGLLEPADASPKPKPLINYLRGDATQPSGEGCRIIAHVVNDKTPNWGGFGFARALQRRWPTAQGDFRDAAADSPNLLRLGRMHTVDLENGLIVASLVAQHGYGPSARSRIRYSALQASLRSLAEFAIDRDATVHMPRIGTGQAGGAWEIVYELIRQTLTLSGVAVTIYDLPEARPTGRRQAALAFNG